MVAVRGFLDVMKLLLIRLREMRFQVWLKRSFPQIHLERYGFKCTLHSQKQGPKKSEPKHHKRIPNLTYFGGNLGGLKRRA